MIRLVAQNKPTITCLSGKQATTMPLGTLSAHCKGSFKTNIDLNRCEHQLIDMFA